MSSHDSLSCKKVSVIMPVHNDQDYIKCAINSVLRQTHSNLELIIVDDFSNDKTLEVIESFSDPRLKVYTFKQNLGAAAARNEALKNAKGDYVAFLDGDDYWLPNKLETQLNFMSENSCSFCCSQYYIISKDDRKLFLMDSPSVIDQKKLRRCCYIGCLTAIYERSVAGTIKVDPRLKKRNDYAIWLKVIEKTGLCFCVPEPLACYRINNNGISHKKASLLKWHFRMFRWQMGYGKISSAYYSLINACFSVFKKLKYRRPIR